LIVGLLLLIQRKRTRVHCIWILKGRPLAVVRYQGLVEVVEMSLRALVNSSPADDSNMEQYLRNIGAYALGWVDNLLRIDGGLCWRFCGFSLIFRESH
jgi:hypothetical protein